MPGHSHENLMSRNCLVDQGRIISIIFDGKMKGVRCEYWPLAILNPQSSIGICLKTSIDYHTSFIMNVTNFLPTLPLEEFSFLKKVIFNDIKKQVTLIY